MKSVYGIFAILLLSLIPFASADSSAIIFIETGNVNATIISQTSATLNWQFTGWNATQCNFQNIAWNEGTGKQQNSQETVNTDGAGDLSIFGWHVFDIELLVTCGIGTTDGTNSTKFGPFDVIIGDLIPPQPIIEEEDPTIFYLITGTLIATVIGLVIILLRKKW